MSNSISVSELYDLQETIAADLLEGITYPWEVLPYQPGRETVQRHLRRKRRSFLGGKKRKGSAYRLPERAADYR